MERECSFGVWPRGNLGAFRFSGEDFEPVAVDLSIGAAPEFWFDEFIGAVRLRGVYDVPGNGMSHQIG